MKPYCSKNQKNSSKELHIDMNPVATDDNTASYWVSNYNAAHDPECCKHFGCGRHLTLQERLYGSYCVHHISKNLTDEAKYIQKMEEYKSRIQDAGTDAETR